MSEFLFPNFLHDAAEYRKAEVFWNDTWVDLISRLNEGQLWETHGCGKTFADGTACRDGNPIFSALSHARGLGIRVIQVEPGDNPRELGVWRDQLGEGEDALSELVIACVLTRENVLAAKDLMTQWVTNSESRSSDASPRRAC